jgi:hypothetical protein
MLAQSPHPQAHRTMLLRIELPVFRYISNVFCAMQFRGRHGNDDRGRSSIRYALAFMPAMRAPSRKQKQYHADKQRHDDSAFQSTPPDRQPPATLHRVSSRGGVLAGRDWIRHRESTDSVARRHRRRQSCQEDLGDLEAAVVAVSDKCP